MSQTLPFGQMAAATSCGAITVAAVLVTAAVAADCFDVQRIYIKLLFFI